MLFDLRGRGRRRTVQGVYLGLALAARRWPGAVRGRRRQWERRPAERVQRQRLQQPELGRQPQEKAALKQIKASPNNPAGWAALVQARWTSAGQGNNFNSTSGQFTTAGRKELSSATQAWQRYLTLTKTPDPNLAVLAARAYAAQGNYAGEASAWEIETGANPSRPRASSVSPRPRTPPSRPARATWRRRRRLTLVPKAQRGLLKTQIQQAKTNPQIAQQC